MSFIFLKQKIVSPKHEDKSFSESGTIEYSLKISHFPAKSLPGVCKQNDISWLSSYSYNFFRKYLNIPKKIKKKRIEDKKKQRHNETRKELPAAAFKFRLEINLNLVIKPAGNENLTVIKRGRI